ncbi:hypothetical protein CC1G_15141 [Coprinopsis cinerea okayama7|uniref:Uncharacterized protein n=1 Tax=Coprinopsis cinerea (strain Okayama-7 / 130 / ATCC MYA-4618 / FGSC 9003) TaxID=240176 RepID=D6RPP5_COPC7|nr:hypothetical protein CC1G_15141 [Coprinopsis cinerea okayama7\|eukprot:XP_002910502.1 hypothetical protein CC1G_15141 [Coprinopsis cinerea okayama7\
MAHSLLSSLPDIEDEVEEDPEQVTSEDIAVKPPKPASPGPEVQGDDGTGTDASEEPHHPGKPKLSLSELLRRADQLREEFPPDHPELGVAKIMGPQSVIFTWKQPRPPGTNVAADGEDTELGDDIIGDPDDAAEAMLLHPELVVYPYDPRSEEAEASKEGVDGDGEGDGDHLLTGSRKEKRKRRKLHKPRYKFDVRTKTIVAGTVIVLGVAMAAAYGMRAQKYGSAGSPFGTHGQKKWAQSQQWFSGAIVGATMKLAQAFGGGENGRGEL